MFAYAFLSRRCVFLPPALVALALVWHFQPRPVEFATLEEFKQFAKEHGLYTHTGTLNNSEAARGNLYAADHSIGREDITPLNPAVCADGPEWKGMAFVVLQVPNRSSQLMTVVDGIHVRRWGNLLVIGEPAFLNRLEQLRGSGNASVTAP